MKDVYIIDGLRTPIGNFGGTLASIRTDDLATLVLKRLMERNASVDFSQLGDVIMGCANQAGEDNRNVARMALLMAGYPINIPGETVNRLCASGMSAIANAARWIRGGEVDLMVAGGVENMTRGPWVMSKASTAYGRDAQLFDSSFGWRFINPIMKELYGVDAMGETAENLADRDSISREDQDAFSLRSHQNAWKATTNGRLNKEIISVEIPQRKGNPTIFNQDEFIKPDTSSEVLAKLKPAFRKDGTVTAGNSSGLNDGAAAMLLASEEGVKKYGLKPLAKILSFAAVGVEPRIMGIGPVEASNKALKSAGISWNQVDIIELNEAFAAQALACIRSWGLKDGDQRINPNGGAIALGHPLGMSGTRITLSAALELQFSEKKYALATMCVGLGQGYAIVLERALNNYI
jgi:3-oxoadipyl-CoA thiolase